MAKSKKMRLKPKGPVALRVSRQNTVERLPADQPRQKQTRNVEDPTKVFVVHGRNEAARKAMFEFLRSIGLKPLEWSQAIALTEKAAPFVGEVLDAAFSYAQAIVVLLTGDDEAKLRQMFQRSNDPEFELTPTPQARPNVLFEAGMALGRNPERTILVEVGSLRPFSDIAGRHMVRMDNSSQRRQDVASRLQIAGCSVDLTGRDWHVAGDFAAAISAATVSSGASIPNESRHKTDERTKPESAPKKSSIDRERREFLRAMGGVGSVVVGTLLLGPVSNRHARMDPTRGDRLDAVLSDQNPTSIRALLGSFHEASQPDLMRRYVAGFTPIILASMASDPEGRYQRLCEVKRVADKLYPTVERDRHRVFVFPSAAAVHAMSFMRDHDLRYAAELIVEAFGFSQREVQEIISQNLVSALTRDNHSWENLWVPDDALESMRSYLARRIENPLLATGSNICVQFLAYYDLALNSRDLRTRGERETVSRQHALIEKTLLEIDSAQDEYGWLGKLWRSRILDVCRHARQFPPEERYSRLPPQGSELILGWRNTHGVQSWRDVLVAGILNHALLRHLNQQLVEGKGSPSWFQKEYGLPEAKVALGKSDEWFRRVGFTKELFSDAFDLAQGPLKETMKELGEKAPEARGADPEWDPIWSLVPFRGRLNPLSPPMPPGKSTPGVDFWAEIFGRGLVGVGLALIIDVALSYFRSVLERTPKEIAGQISLSRESLEAVASAPETKEHFDATADLVSGDSTKYDSLMKKQD